MTTETPVQKATPSPLETAPAPDGVGRVARDEDVRRIAEAVADYRSDLMDRLAE